MIKTHLIWRPRSCVVSDRGMLANNASSKLAVSVVFNTNLFFIHEIQGVGSGELICGKGFQDLD